MWQFLRRCATLSLLLNITYYMIGIQYYVPWLCSWLVQTGERINTVQRQQKGIGTRYWHFYFLFWLWVLYVHFITDPLFSHRHHQTNQSKTSPMPTPCWWQCAMSSSFVSIYMKTRWVGKRDGTDRIKFVVIRELWLILTLTLTPTLALSLKQRTFLHSRLSSLQLEGLTNLKEVDE